MAETSLPVTPGTGTNVAGFTDPAGNFRQTITVGDAATGSTASVDPAAGLATNDITVGGLVQQLIDLIAILRDAQNATAYARDISDQLRVNVAQGSLTVNGLTWASNGSYAPYYAQGGPNSVDTREQLEEAANLNFNYIRTQRWVIT